MKRISMMSWLVVPLSVGLLVTACGTYYKVKDPATGSIYYTEKVKREKGGAANFKDARSGSEVTIQNSEVKEIGKDEFDAGRFAAETKSAPAPTQTAPPVAAPTTAPTPEPTTAPTPEPTPAPDQGSPPEQKSE
jgi:hypothetical protein